MVSTFSCASLFGKGKILPEICSDILTASALSTRESASSPLVSVGTKHDFVVLRLLFKRSRLRQEEFLLVFRRFRAEELYVLT